MSLKNLVSFGLNAFRLSIFWSFALKGISLENNLTLSRVVAVKILAADLTNDVDLSSKLFGLIPKAHSARESKLNFPNTS